MEMLDRIIYKVCGWIDNQFQKVEDVLTAKQKTLPKFLQKKIKKSKKKK